MPVHFNPFDDSYLKSTTGKPNSVNAPEKIDETKTPGGDNQSAKGIGAIEKSDENELIDLSSMADDMDNFFDRKGQE